MSRDTNEFKRMMEFAREKCGEAGVANVEHSCAAFVNVRVEDEYKKIIDHRYIWMVSYHDRDYNDTLFVIAKDALDAHVLARRDFGTSAQDITVEKLGFVLSESIPDGMIGMREKK